MKVLVTGVNGQLGYDVVNAALSRGHSCFGTDITDIYKRKMSDLFETTFSYYSLDITNPEAVRQLINNLSPDVVVHCAAWTAVDDAENKNNYYKVQNVNVNGTKNIATATAAIGAKIIYISTDYVFDGSGCMPWDPDSISFCPLNVYGQSKLDGEIAVKESTDRYFIVRTAWLFGLNGNNFVNTMISVAKTHDKVRVVCDQIGRPTYAQDLARLLVDMSETERYGCYHATNEGDFVSWFDFCNEIYKQSHLDVDVIPVTTQEYGLNIAKRPMNSRLDTSKLSKNGFDLLPTWKNALSRYIGEKNGQFVR